MGEEVRENCVVYYDVCKASVKNCRMNSKDRDGCRGS